MRRDPYRDDGRRGEKHRGTYSLEVISEFPLGSGSALELEDEVQLSLSSEFALELESSVLDDSSEFALGSCP